MDDLLTEIEHIVSSGTKVNLDYYINEEVDEDKQDDIYEYFQEEAETDSLEAALEELGEDDYSVEEIRLVRIKFISEFGH
jgi:ATP-dependent DNA helicase RecQ